MPGQEFEEVLRFWFPTHPKSDHQTMVRQLEWWFRGGADAAITDRFGPLLERARRGELDDWSSAPRSRLALIIVLDQFSRTLHRGTPAAFAQDEKARRLTVEGEVGHYAAHPHRNAILGRQSTPEELDYLARGDLVHTRPIPE